MPTATLCRSLALLVALFVTLTARAAEPPTAPQLRIETGMHSALLKRIGVDAAGRFLVTASYDKTARVWDAATGELLQTLRPPIGAGNEGKIFSVAISPDGETVACGGSLGFEWDQSNSIYLFERRGGRMLRRIEGLPINVISLAYSRNGRYLAAGLGLTFGMRVFDVTTGGQLAGDAVYKDHCYSVDFDGQGRLLTASYDGYLRLYGRDYKLLARVRAGGGSQPYTARFAPDGKRIAVGYANSTRVSIVSGETLAPLYEAATQDIDNGYLSSVAWSSDGAKLYAGGRYQNEGEFRLRRWLNGGQGAASDLKLGVVDVFGDLCPAPEGGLFWAAGEPVFGRLDAADRPLYTVRPNHVDQRGGDNSFRVASDALTVAFDYQFQGGAAAQYNVGARLITTAIATGLTSPRVSVAGLSLTDFKSSRSPKLNGRPLTLQANEASYSGAIAPAGDFALLGCDWSLRCFDRTGVQVWQATTPGAAWSVAVAGNLALAAYADGTIRWYNLRDGRELLAFFPHRDRKRWVAWTPSGYYDCSPGGEDLIGWHVNNGKAAAAYFFPASRFRESFYRPAVVQNILTTLDEAAAVRLGEQGGKQRHEPQVEKQLPPIIRIQTQADGVASGATKVTLRYDIDNPSGEPVTAVRSLVDGRPYKASRDLQLVKADRSKGGSIEVEIPERDCEISLVAENRFAASEPARIRVRWQPVAPPTTTTIAPAPTTTATTTTTTGFVIKPKLYVLAIGVSKYQDTDLNLNFAAKDARDIAASLTTQKGILYADVQTRVLTDDKATKEEILDGLDWIQHETTSKDVAMVFLSGHGANDPSTGTYFFVPHNFDREKIKRTGVPHSDIKTTVQSLAGKALFFVDSCHSGNVMGEGKTKGVADITEVVNELASVENGVVVFSASTGSQLSWEDDAWGNGAFTKALLDGLKGGADYNKDGRITVNMLDLYISESVKKLTKGRQTPTTQKPPTVPDFPVAMAGAR